MKPLTRRRSLAAMAAWALGAGRARASESLRYAVISLVGDELDIVYAALKTGSHLDRRHHRPVPDASGGFDSFVLATITQAVEGHDSQAKVAPIGVGPSALHQTPERLFDGSNIALPDSLVAALDQTQATHVVLLTKHRSEGHLTLVDTQVEVGTLRGLGYYIDRSKGLKIVESGETGHGLIAPYAHVQLTLADSRGGAIVSQRLITATRVYAVVAHATAIDPWDVLSAQEKVRRLQLLLKRELAREVPLLLKAD